MKLRTVNKCVGPNSSMQYTNKNSPLKSKINSLSPSVYELIKQTLLNWLLSQHVQKIIPIFKTELRRFCNNYRPIFLSNRRISVELLTKMHPRLSYITIFLMETIAFTTYSLDFA